MLGLYSLKGTAIVKVKNLEENIVILYKKAYEM